MLAAGGGFAIAARAATNEDEIPPLLPPRGELPAKFWEQHGWLVILAAFVVALLLALLVYWLRRPKLQSPPTAALVARRGLEALRGRAEDGALVVEVSRIFRRYMVFAFGLPPEELTTAEVRKALQAHPQSDPELASASVDFLARCDERKFAPAPPAAPLGVVAVAGELIDKLEVQRQRQQQIELARAQSGGGMA